MINIFSYSILCLCYSVEVVRAPGWALAMVLLLTLGYGRFRYELEPAVILLTGKSYGFQDRRIEG
jgi:hypothetical protein